MENITTKFDKGKNSVLVENNAQTIYDHLNELEKNSKIYSKRWFWELLQNAKDSVDNNSKVSVKVILDGNILSFLHTGDAFEDTDILHLIFHGSSKKSLEGKTGRFGTGFMSTHLLSRKVNIIGKLADDTYFKFDLNREASSVLLQQENLEKSYALFCASNRLESYSEGKYNTIFTYDLSELSIKIANEGIYQLQQILPFVMAFNEKIENIEVVNNSKSTSIKRGNKEEVFFKDQKVITQEIFYNDIIDYVVFVKSDDSEVAVLLEKKDEFFSLMNLNDNYPKLFFDFPLFGTEKFGCPVVINSTKFDLKGERDGIYLGAADKDMPTIIENKKIISNSLNFLSILIEFLSEKQTLELYNLFKLTSPFEYSWLHKEWLETLYDNKINNLLNAVCLVLKDTPLRLKELIVPFSKNIEGKQFYKLVTDFISDRTPQFTEALEWIIVAEGFSKLQKKEIGDYDFIVNESILCKRIEEKKTLDEINTILKKVDDTNLAHLERALSWFNDLFNLLSKEQTEYLSSHYNIIPNQKKYLVKKELSTPYIDKIGDEKIKIVIDEFGWDIKSDLIFPGINVKDGIFQSFTLDKALVNISSASDKISDDHLLDRNTRRALISNLKWLIDNKKISLIKDAFVVVEKGRESNELSFSKRRLFQTNADKLIASSVNWIDKYSIYKDIVLKKFVLIDEYTNQLTTDDFIYLQSLDFIFNSPLIFKSRPTKNDLKLLIKKPELYSKLLNDKEDVINNNIEYSDIAYLTRSDDNILSKTADSIKSAKLLLKFLLSEVLEKDVFFNQISQLTINGETITVNKCLWAARLRDTQWVPIKSAEGEKQSNSERPSVANITELIRDESEILNIIKTKNAALFFNQLGISVADIIRNSLASEEEKLKWDMTFSQLLTNGKINPDLAIEMLEDPQLQKVYLERKEKRERIKANQKIGYLFEALFKEIFESNEYKEDGFIIERKAIGSDFNIALKQERVIDVQDILSDAEEEILFKIGNVLIEPKATGKNIAEMTPTQAEVASRNIKNYVLAVLPLNNFALNKDSVKEHSRFVVNIAEPLSDRYNDYKSYSAKKVETTQEKTDISLHIEEGEVRYQVKSEIWESSMALRFDEFVNWLKSVHFTSEAKTISTHSKS